AVPSVVATKDGRATFGACGSGGYRITSGVLHTLVHALDFGMNVQAAVDAPRVHCQGDDTYVDARIPATVQTQLRERGHRVIVQQDTPDRKSTRLNSSHLGMSYAVFCVKKKTMYLVRMPCEGSAKAGICESPG